MYVKVICTKELFYYKKHSKILIILLIIINYLNNLFKQFI